MNFSKEIQALFEEFGPELWEVSGLPELRRVGVIEAPDALEAPFVGKSYASGGLLVLQSSDSADPPLSVIHEGLDLVKESSRSSLEFLFVTALATVLLGRYGESSSKGEFRSLIPDLHNPEGVLNFIETIERIAFGKMAQAYPGNLSSDQREEFRKRWLETVLRGELKILAPYYIIVLGDNEAAWEIISHSLEASAWRRETDSTKIGHALSLRGQDMVTEVMIVGSVPETADDLSARVEEFRKFIDGGFLLGNEPFDFVAP